MTQLIELPEKFIHKSDNISALLFDDFIEITNIAEENGNFLLFLLKSKLISLQMVLDELWNQDGKDIIHII